MALVLDTGEVPVDARHDTWSDALSRALVPVKVTASEPGSLLGRLRSHRLGYMRTVSLDAGPQRISRPPSLCRPAPGERFALGLCAAGEAVLTQAGRSCRSGPGEIIVVDLAQPFALAFPEPFRLRLVHLPQRSLGSPRTLARLAGSALRSDGGAVTTLGLLLTRVLNDAARFGPTAAERLAGHVADLVDAIAVDGAGNADADGAREPATAREHLVSRVHAHVDAHLGEPGLDPESVARALRISVRYLHRLFEGEELTVARLIQQRRVEACARTLERHGPFGPTLAEVAGRHGFSNPAHFSRAFRAAYGITPSEWRSRRGGAPVAPRDEAA
ncbi:helix-turn-helix domain-containing protein [Kitasatospora sp. NPDC048365]|uniref:AraC-like ligand-binding domain-containing protein n=1 Tax=Kitasatospora sp. NPDC048365 TaxID=3364050 RepID=UPI00371C3C5C